MLATEVLKEEHKAIKVMLDVLEEICNRLEAGGMIEHKHLEQVLEFIRTFADKCHQGKEKDLLFPAMEEAGVPRKGGPIGVMLEEHEIGRDYVSKFAHGIEKYKKGNKEAVKKNLGKCKKLYLTFKELY
jgi:hemerythrin-like domain-containing protein